MLIFLDLDGVLRRTQSPFYKLDPDCLRAFEGALRELPEALVVITSSWREAMALDSIRSHFSPDIRLRIVGTTPIAKLREGPYRHREVLGYLKQINQPSARWIAIDDDASLYPAVENLVIVNPSVGFDAVAAVRLLQLAALVNV